MSSPISPNSEIELHSPGEQDALQKVVVVPNPSPAAANGTSSEEHAPDANSADRYLELLQTLKKAWKDQPDLSITWHDLSYTVEVAKTDTSVPNLASAFANLALKPFKANDSFKSRALVPASGVVRPGTMTLILASPGHGKTTLLKALSGRLNHDSNLGGEVRYNGLNEEQNKERGVYVSRFCSFVGQQDLLFPTLTVRETMNFSSSNAIANPSLLRSSATTPEEHAFVDALEKLEPERADRMIELLGLAECTNTIVGNDLLRGVSGGQRKRCAIGEMLLANSRTFCLDEVSVGLDAAVTLHIFNALKQVCAISNSSVVTALLQPTPETYALFDNVILLAEGRTVFHGPREDVAEWLWSVAGLEVPPGVDEAGFVVDFLTDPANTYEQAAINAEIRMRNAEGRTVGLEEQSAKKVSAVTTVANSSMRNSQANHDTAVPAPVQVPAHTNGLSIDAASPETAHAVTFHLQSESPSSGKQTNAVAPAPAPAASSASVTIAPITGNGLNSEKLKQLRTMSSSGSFAQAYHSQPAASPVYTSIDIEKRYKATRWYTNMLADVDSSLKQYQPFDISKWSDYTKAQFAHSFPHSFVKHTLLCCGRQSKLIARNKAFIPPRVMQAIIMGIVVGTLFYQLTPTQYTDKTALLLYVIMFGAFANLTELPVASEARNVVAKQIDAGQFPASAYTISVNLLHFPVTFFETIIFGCLLYFLAGFSLDAGRFFFFLLTMTICSHALSTFFRSISYIAKNPDVARSMDLPFIIMFVIFGGWLITLPHVPDWLIWVFYISPFSWAFRSLCLNEFNDPRFDALVTGNDGGIIREGDSYIQQFGLQLTSEWKWYGILYLAGFYAFFTLCNILLLARLKPITPLGTRLHRTNPNEEAARENVDAENSPASINAINVAPKAVRPGSAEPGAPAEIHHEKKLGLNNKRSFQLTALPFTPVTLAWKNVNYSVEVVNDQKQKHWRRLLNDINGFAAPGRLTALMGSSGAGKTTLMDLLAGRKTMGKIEGEILVNGYPKENASFAKVTGYVEQNDIHMGASTVREALQFSAKLRLPTSVAEEDRERFIDEVMALVGLTDIADRMIGDIALPGLSSGQLKLVTIGVELVANPSVLFLDEPTSGIDAPSAARVMKAVRRIAATGRTVLCTIHQPSEQIFLMFDRLLLLKTGGRDVFFSDCGHKGNNLVNYFEAASGYTMLLPRGSKEVLPNGKIKHSLKINPANWMLQVVGSSAPPPPAGSKPPETEQERLAASTDYADLWRSSDLFRQAQADTEEAAQPKPNSKPIEQADLNSNQYVSNWTRYIEVQKRLFISHWRNPPMNVTRFTLMFVTGLILGVIYYKVNANDFGGVISKLSVVFMGLSFPSSVCANSALPSLFRTRAVYYRETTIGLYGYKIFSLSIFLTELPYIFMADVLFILPFYFMIGFANDAVLFFRFLLSAFLLAMTYSSLSQLWLALMPNQIASNVINGLFMSLFFMFGGLLRRPSNIAIGWKWFYAINPVPKAFLTAALGQFYCDSSNPLNNCPMITPGPGEPPQYTYEYLTSFLETTVNNYGSLIGYLILEIVVLRILILIAMAKVSHIKR